MIRRSQKPGFLARLSYTTDAVSKDTWFTEFLALHASLSCTVAIVGILISYNKHEVFDWHGLTLNAIVSTLSTASRALLIYAVAETVSQYKWILFSEKQRTLVEFEDIDSASRGPLGCIRLLGRRRLGLGLTLGTVIVVLALAIDPFIQQLIKVETTLKFKADTQANLPIAKRYARASGAYDVEEKMFESAGFGLANPLNMTQQQLMFDCPTGNCKWGPAQSLAICSTCQDITHELSVLNSTYAPNGNSKLLIGLPNGLGMINNSQYGLTAFATNRRENSVAFSTNDLFLWSLSFINYTSNGSGLNITLHDYLATECVLELCANKYNSSVVNGTFFESSKQLTSATRNPESWYPYATSGSNATSADDIYGQVGSDGIYRTDLQLVGGFNISDNAVAAIDNTLSAMLQATDNVQGDDTWDLNATGTVFSYRSMQFTPNDLRYIYYSNDLTSQWAALAMGMTNAIRNYAENASLVAVKGESASTVALYVIQWPCISLPATLVALSYVFLFVGRHDTRAASAPMWKSCQMAVLATGAMLHTDLNEINERPDTTLLHRHMAEIRVRLAADSSKYAKVEPKSTDTRSELSLLPVAESRHRTETSGNIQHETWEGF